MKSSESKRKPSQWNWVHETLFIDNLGNHAKPIKATTRKDLLEKYISTLKLKSKYPTGLCFKKCYNYAKEALKKEVT